jgi:hypothetical protein
MASETTLAKQRFDLLLIIDLRWSLIRKTDALQSDPECKTAANDPTSSLQPEKATKRFDVSSH